MAHDYSELFLEDNTAPTIIFAKVGRHTSVPNMYFLGKKKSRTRPHFCSEIRLWGKEFLPFLFRGGFGRKHRALQLESLSSSRKSRMLNRPMNRPGGRGPLGVFKKFVQKKFVRIFLSYSRFPFCNIFRLPISLQKGLQGRLRGRKLLLQQICPRQEITHWVINSGRLEAPVSPYRLLRSG